VEIFEIFHGDQDSNHGLLGCDAVWWCKRPTFRRVMLPPSSVSVYANLRICSVHTKLVLLGCEGEGKGKIILVF